MHKYTELTDREPRYQGGFIWDYIDQSIYKKDRYGKWFLWQKHQKPMYLQRDFCL